MPISEVGIREVVRVFDNMRAMVGDSKNAAMLTVAYYLRGVDLSEAEPRSDKNDFAAAVERSARMRWEAEIGEITSGG